MKLLEELSIKTTDIHLYELAFYMSLTPMKISSMNVMKD
jgi:hypothetical protein